jgi:hypothetical protein
MTPKIFSSYVTTATATSLLEYKILWVVRFWLSQVRRQGRQAATLWHAGRLWRARLRAIVQRRSLRARLDLYGWLVLWWPK